MRNTNGILLVFTEQPFLQADIHDFDIDSSLSNIGSTVWTARSQITAVPDNESKSDCYCIWFLTV